MKELFEMARQQLKEEKEKIKRELFPELFIKEDLPTNENNNKDNINNSKIMYSLLDNFNNEINIHEDNTLSMCNKNINIIDINNIYHEDNTKFVDVINHINGQHYKIVLQDKIINLVLINKNDINKRNCLEHNKNLEKPINGRKVICNITGQEFISITNKYTQQELKDCLEKVTNQSNISPYFAYYIVCYILNGNCGKLYINNVIEWLDKYFPNNTYKNTFEFLK